MPVKKIQPEPEKATFEKVAVKPEAKREINLLAASENRHVYEVVADMLETYKAVKVGRLPKPKNDKSVTIVEAIQSHN